MTTSKSVTARAHLGVASRRFRDQPERIVDARRELAAAKIEDFIQRTVDSAPPLTESQRERIAQLLRPASPAVGGSDAA